MSDTFLMILLLFSITIFSLVIVLNHAKLYFLVILGGRPIIDLVFTDLLDFQVAGIESSQLFGFLIFCSFMMIAFNTKSYMKRNDVKSILFFIIYLIISFIIIVMFFPHQNIDIIDSLSNIMKIIILPVTVLIILKNFQTMKDYQKIVDYIVKGYLLFLAVVVLIHFLKPEMLWRIKPWAVSFDELRFTAGFKSPSKLAQYLVMCFPIFLLNWKMGKQKNLWIVAVIIISFLVMLYLSRYRTCQIALLIFLFSIGFFYKQFKYISLGVILLCFLSFYSNRFQDGVNQLISFLVSFISGKSSTIQGDLFTGRIGHWQVLLSDYIKSHPSYQIFGKGAGSSYWIIKAYTQRGWGAHNGYIQVLIEYGLIGLILYIKFLGSLFSKCKSNLSKINTDIFPTVIVLSTIFMHLVLCLATNVIIGQFSYNIYFAVIISVTFYSINAEPKHIRKANNENCNHP